MIIRKAEFLTSAVSKLKYPLPDRPEIAFVGRSNVGKSSLINSMLNRKALARTSSEPGKTRLINFFNINDMIYFVDLPGYGYAKVSKVEKAKWGGIIEEYLFSRENLVDVVMLVDIRREPTFDDKLMYAWIKSYNRCVTVVVTKADKIPRSQYQKQTSMIKKTLELKEEDTMLIYSAKTKQGRDELWALFDGLLGIDEPFRA